MKNPGKKVPHRSLRIPTIMRDMNIPAPEKVSNEPQTRATFLGSRPANSMVLESRVGTYIQELTLDAPKRAKVLRHSEVGHAMNYSLAYRIPPTYNGDAMT